MTDAVALVLGPDPRAVSGVSTHLTQLFGSDLGRAFRLVHFQVGSEGRTERVLTMILRLLWSPIWLAAVILSQRAWLVHLNTSLETKSFWRDVAYLAVAKALRRRVVYQVHGGALPAGFFSSRWLTPLLGIALRWPDAVVVLAQSELQAYREFVPAQRIVLIPNAVRIEEWWRGSRSSRRQLSPFRLGYVGRLAEDKGLRESVRALAIARRRGIPTEMIIAGCGPAEPNLKRLIVELGLEESVRFLGPLFGADKAALWRDLDVFVFPTYHREGLPYALLESMAAGTPVISTRVGAIPDVMEHGIHGLFVPLRDVEETAAAIETLYTDIDLWGRMSQACEQRIREHYTVERLAKDFVALYRSLERRDPLPGGIL